MKGKVLNISQSITKYCEYRKNGYGIKSAKIESLRNIKKRIVQIEENNLLGEIADSIRKEVDKHQDRRGKQTDWTLYYMKRYPDWNSDQQIQKVFQF